ncbi:MULTISPECIES: hypothetical protein [Leuconostoc]|uniref:Bacteriocin immunity protein n=1 Tax=Leuconostoc pseudomesenteroides TaxID=33968 RepID=A0A1X0VFN4_LEUPS|nr:MULTISPECIES: hypothetical protein [Leuconostoc]KDA48282.1 hypothetical protein L964_282 [Leuconostoc pseudomesenteroides 1159]KDA50697.1 hypothetical protein L965_1235 [Leuconostoc pseudomesenteroides PS12]CCJ66250.1 hypothetical protein Q5C_09460 [Leuconostoc pseudomesenteroides 4882]MCT4418714.1 hypothetical protein [Leuconostoc falkenbergense]MDG9744014.1 hypothetical protein [Leuconostoc falkenbergense]
MSERKNNLIDELITISVNETEQKFVSKAIHQLRDEQQSEKVVVKNLVYDLKSVIINNQKLSEPALKLLNQLNKPDVGFSRYFGMF